MAHTTRRGTQFSPFELDTIDIGPPIEQVDIIRSRFSIAPHIQEALRLADLRDTMLDEMDEGCADEDDEWEDEALVASRAPTPLSRAPTPLSRSASTSSHFAQHHASLSRSPSPLSELSDPPSPLPLDDPDATRRRHRADKKKKRRQRKRVARVQTVKFGPLPKAKHSQAYRERSPHQIALDASNIAASFSRWAGPPPSKKTKLTRHRLRTLKALLEDDNDLVQWDGRGIKLIVDAEGRIVAVLLGRPDDEDWDEVVRQFELLMEGVRLRGEERGIFKAQNRQHRRGTYYFMGSGVTKGPGQMVCRIRLHMATIIHFFLQKPGNLKHSKEYRQLLQLLILNHHIHRMIGLQSSGLARYVPKLYGFLSTTLKGIYEKHPELEQLFTNSVFPAATWNLGPDVVTEEHNDLLNFGMCGISSGGNYNYKRGGHLWLKQLKLVVDGHAWEHPIAKGETRYSMTQYAAVRVPEREGSSGAGGWEGEEGTDRRGSRGAGCMGLGLFSKIDELEEDRRARTTLKVHRACPRRKNIVYLMMKIMGPRWLDLAAMTAAAEGDPRHLGGGGDLPTRCDSLKNLKDVTGYDAHQRAKARVEEASRRRRTRIDARLPPADDLLRRGIHIHPTKGLRQLRSTPLAEDDLYLDTAHPTLLGEVRLEHTCTLCLNAKSHPVSYKCKHSHCYVCICISLETSWSCPQCQEEITARPVQDNDGAAEIEGDHPGWDQSRVAYSLYLLQFEKGVHTIEEWGKKNCIEWVMHRVDTAVHGNDQRDVSQSVVDEIVHVDPTLASLQAEWGVSPIPGKK
ncbi:hypothetical protein B0H13DRAFT_1867581 [Mycena leptocephala]|nr:hypothetical protein B0H13DRAFT_1867581 [Mycena leptocephala]